MRLDDPLPAGWREALARLGAGDEPVRFSLASDLDRERRFGTGHVAITDRRVVAFAGSAIVVDLPFSGLKEARIDELFGAARLVGVRADAAGGDGDGAHETIAWYSRALVPQFAVAARVINDLKAGRPAALPEGDPVAWCRTCGGPLPERGGSCPACVPRRRIIGRLLGLLAPYRWHVASLMAITLVMVGAQLLPPLITKMIVDRVISEKDPAQRHIDELPWWIAAMIGCAAFFLIARLINGRLTGWLSGRLVTDLRVRLHVHLQRLRMGWHNRRESGEVVGRVMNDTGELQQFLVEGVPFLISNAISFVAIAGILLWIDPWLALLVFLPTPFLILGGGFFWRRLTPLLHKRSARVSQMHTALSESIGGIKAVKITTQEARRDRIFSTAAESWLQVNTGLARTWQGFSESMMFIMSVGVALVWYFAAGRIVGSGDLTTGDLLAYVGYIWLFYGPLQWFTAVFNWLTHAVTSAERIFAMLDEKPEIAEGPGTVALPTVRGDIAFSDVRFSYERGKEVLKGITLRVAPGTMVGLVGKSGSGKSTIIGLVCRFFDPDSGAITLDGQALDTVPLDQLRTSIGIVMQDPYLFNASILENIRFGRPDASFADVVRAAQAARCHDFILDKEDGYDTAVGERGAKLSGGERQRISIARAILHDPPILILDEATSAVDSETEQAIQEAIAALIKGRTTIAIAHRLATLRNADRLIVIDDGTVVEEGTHADLLARPDGHFAKLVRMQQDNNRMREEVFTP